MAKEVWNKIALQAKKRLPESQFEMWIKPLSFIKLDNDVVYVTHPNPLAASFIEKEFKGFFEEILRELQIEGLSVSVLDLSLQNGEELVLRQEALSSDKKQPKTSQFVMSLNPLYTFENFVPTHTNQFAYATSLAVSQNPAREYNPLYIYGGVGLGKTHLLQSIAHHLLENSKNLVTFYLSAERFMNEMVSSITHKNQQAFREKYRKVDVLILDDVQFVKEKTGTQEELFHTFNALYEGQKQIVISSDCTPSELQGIEDRLRSRFAWGLIAEIQQPDLETKIAILHKKAEAKKITIPDDVALYIASHINSNIRELEGCLTRLMAVSAFKGRPITMSLAEEALQKQFGLTTRLLTIEAIQKHIAAAYKLKPSDLKEKSNKAEIVVPRQIAMYICKELLKSSLKEIGRKFGGKDHTTVLHSIKKVESKMQSDKGFQQIIEGLKRGLC
jgi:chromosomal replication initiator protein